MLAYAKSTSGGESLQTMTIVNIAILMQSEYLENIQFDEDRWGSKIEAHNLKFLLETANCYIFFTSLRIMNGFLIFLLH